MSGIKQLIKKVDLFASMQFLRFKSDAETKTLTGGLISLAVVGFLIGQFSTMIIDTFAKVLISSVTDSTQAIEPPPLIYSTHQNGKYYMLGLQLWGYDLTTGPRYFDITAVNSVLIQGLYSSQTVNIALEPCTINHWSGLADVETLFTRVGMNTWLCLPVNQTYKVSGKYISAIQRSIDFTVSTCNNATDPTRPCATPAQIDAFLKADSQLYWTPFFMNPLLNPQSQDYLTYYLQDKWYVMSGINYGAEMYIYNDDYQITTDESILPFTEEHVQTGPIVNSIFANTYNLDNTSNIYFLLNIFRAPNSIIITRQFQKVLDAFAYVGGLLGSFMLLLIAINFYNEASYELNFASALYQPEKDSPSNFRSYNLFFFVLQGIFTVFRIVKVNLPWKSTRFFNKTRVEMAKQLDVMLLFKKIYILESGMKLLLSKAQLRGLMLQHEMNVSEAREIRKLYSLKYGVAKMAKHKLQNQSRDGSSDVGGGGGGGAGSLAQIGHSEFQLNDTYKKTFDIDGKRTRIRENNNRIGHDEGRQEQKNEQVNLQDFGSDSESSDADEDEHLKKQTELLDDLYELQDDCIQNNPISKKIFDSIDPRIKKLLERTTSIKFHESEKLCKIKSEMRIDLNQNAGDIQLKNIQVRNPNSRRSQLKKQRSNEKLQEIDNENNDFTYINS